MPPKAKVTREMVLDAAFETVREKGHESLNARAIAQRLGCSTQPVLYCFRTVDEIREAVYRRADKYHSAYILPREGTAENPMLAMGLNYVRFGYEEKHLFRLLFQTDRFGGMDMAALLENPELRSVLDVMAAGQHIGREEAKERFLAFFAVVHGLASLLANNSMEYDEKRSARVLETVFHGMGALRKGQEDV